MKRFRIWLARLILPRDMQIIRAGSIVLRPDFAGTITHKGPAGGGGKGGNATVHGSGIAIGGQGSPNGTATVEGKGPLTWPEYDKDGNLHLMQAGGGYILRRAAKASASITGPIYFADEGDEEPPK